MSDFKAECAKFDFRCMGSAPDPAGGANSALPVPLAGFIGGTERSEGRGRGRVGKREEEKKESEGEGVCKVEKQDEERGNRKGEEKEMGIRTGKRQ